MNAAISWLTSNTEGVRPVGVRSEAKNADHKSQVYKRGITLGLVNCTLRNSANANNVKRP